MAGNSCIYTHIENDGAHIEILSFPLFSGACLLLPYSFCFSQRLVSRLSKCPTVGSQSPGPLRSSAASAAPAGPGSAFSAHTGHKHCWLPSGAARWRGQVRMRLTVVYETMVLHEASDILTLESFLLSTRYPISSQGEECPPPPPVSWGHVTGLQASLLGHLKGFVKNLDNPAQRESSLAVIPAYLVYLQAYYHQLSRQVQVPASCTSHM